MKKSEIEPRPMHWLRVYNQRYPGAFKGIEALALTRLQEGKPLWPPYVYVPLEATWAVILGDEPGPPPPTDPRVHDVAPLTALAGWRLTKGIYRFAPELFEELWESPFKGPIPVEPLRHLPEYVVYVETPGQVYLGEPLKGFFAFVTVDLTHGNEELYLFWDYGEEPPGLSHTVVHLGGLTVEEGLREAAGEGIAHLSPEERKLVAERFRLKEEDLEAALESSIQINREFAERALSLLFFLALSDDIKNPRNPEQKPRRPTPKATRRRGLRFFAADGPTTWDVGVRFATALRKSYQQAGHATGTSRKKRPHVRRAHWHGYWVGPRNDPEKRHLELRWLPPILVGVKGEEITPEDLPAVVWRVKA